MAKLGGIKRIIVEDFPQESQALVSKLSFTINPLLEQITNAFSKNIDFDNLNQQYSSITIKVNSSGIPTTAAQLKYTLKTKIKGIQCIRAVASTSNIYPTSQPFISFTMQNDIITIDHISGLVNNEEFTLYLVILG